LSKKNSHRAGKTKRWPHPSHQLTILHRTWRELYKPLLDEFFSEAASKGISLTPDVALKEMEQVLESVFLSIERASKSEHKKVSSIQPRLYLRLERNAFCRKAHHYAVDLFYKPYISHKHETPRDLGRSALQQGKGIMSQPQMIKEVLSEHGGPLYVDKIAEAIQKRFGVKLKRHDITSVIYRAMRKRKIFRKEGISTFALATHLPGK
jgi:hypothetical protein